MNKRLFIKVVSVFVSINMLTQVFYPTVAFALTGGPSQPEMQNFEPVDQTQNVDLSTGSFSYNIPLMDVEGYPINLSYHSGITMDQEASWVGLGWNINPGEINRQVRGLPDDFNGDQVTQSYNIKPNITVGFNEGAVIKLAGFPITGALNTHAGVFYNNYNGPGLDFGYSASLSAGVANAGPLTTGLNMGMGLDFNSQSGLDISRSIGLGLTMTTNNNQANYLGLTVGTSYNSREGIRALTISKDIGSGTSTEYTYSGGGAGIESGYSFTNPTYVPAISMPINNYALTLHFASGLALLGSFFGDEITGYTTIQALVNNTVTHPAYGYMNSDQAFNDANALHDFNREKDVPYQTTMANLPITNFTYDLYNASAEGMQMQFRPFRGDVGILYDHQNSNQSLSASLGLEMGFGDFSHLGIDVGFNYSNTNRGRWTAENVFNSAVSFASVQVNNPSYEPFYFKGTGEKSVNDTSYYKTINGTSPMYVQLNQSGPDVTAQSIFTNGGNVNSYISGNLKKTQREKRNRSFNMLTASEATNFALDKTINSYPYDKSVYDSGCASQAGITQYPRMSHPAFHTSEITVTNDDGRRFVYGIPAYNTLQKEVSFAVQPPGNSGNYAIDSTNLVSYTPNVDNSTGNQKGIDNYYNAQTLPSYAHSYLLTEVLSPDYVDLTNNGVTDDDLGQAVKFNYTCMYNQANPYQWRVPYDTNAANYQQQFISNNQYDRGNYIYGKKEIWYVHSIESKTMVAQFILGSRQDALGAAGENGGKDPSHTQQYLKEIDLYSKADLIKNGSKATPIKSVHFEYDYKLCHLSPNSNASDSTGTKGKLTLRKVYFTYGNNTEGALNSYQFAYSSENPVYSHNQTDRWGNYKYNPPGMPPNMYFPYTLQDSIRTNKFATAWELTNITLPSGGTIKVNYESNDYAYVQTQRAGQMFTVLGVNSTASTSSMTGQLYTYTLVGGPKFNDWVIVHLPTHCTNSTDFYNKYLAGISKLYFRFLVDMDHNSHYEYVPGYADIASSSLINDSTGAIQLGEATNTGSKDVPSANEIALASWQYARLNLPGYAYPGSNTMSGSPLSMIMALGAVITDIADLVVGFDLRALASGYGKNFIPAYSVLRLDNPNYKKYGGGCRVKEMDFSDSWATMTDSLQSSFTYGQTYNYTTTITNAAGKVQTISSGVATYEPLLGGDENPLRQPLPYDEKYILAPNNNYYTETPLGEDLFPAPGIVYSKVTVTNLKYPGVNRTATGYAVNQFYTAYDYPTLTDKTSLVNDPYKPSFLLSLLSIGIQNYTTASMGFTVEVNDMAGKMRKQEVHDKNGSLISSIEYDYKVDNPSAPNMHLNNNVSVANPDGSIGKASVGLDIDTWEDMREEDTQTYGIDVSYNNDFWLIPFFPIPIPGYSFTIWPSFSAEHTRFRSAATTKYIHRTGLLDHVIKTENGSQVTSQNLLYDSETGDVLLTETNNEFNKEIYNFTYPAHWAYDGMGSAYRNIGVYVSPVTTNSSGAITTPSLPGNYLAPGDELEYFRPKVGFSDTLAWVTQPQVGGYYVIMDRNGKPIVMNNCLVKVIRSGRRNMQTVPIGQVTSMLSPAGSKKLFMNDSLQILQASGTLFNNTWKVPNTNILKQVCSSTGGPPDSCIARFFDSLEVHGQVYAAPGDSIKFGKYAPACSAYSNELYYALSERQGEDQATLFQAQLGNCVLTITPYPVNYDRGTGTKLLYMDSLSTFSGIDYKTGIYYGSIQGTDTTGGCINLYGNVSIYGIKPPSHELIISDGEQINVYYKLKAKMCISCMTCTNVCSNVSVDSAMNPYAIGLLGNWRPERNYLYYDTRSPALASTTSNIWNTGIYNHFNPIWKLSSGTWNPDTASTSDKNWTWPSHITMYDTKGNEIEEVNALGVYSSVLFGYIQSMPVAHSVNAKYKEIAFDGFEDYGFSNVCSSPCDSGHFDFKGAIASDPTHVDTTSAQAHTGKYSLKISSGNSATLGRSINYFNGAIDSTTPTKFIMLPGGTLPLFSPDSGSYILSAWVKEGVACGVTGYTQDSIVVNYIGSTAKYIMKPSGPVIEGWQRFESRFKVPKSATKINVELVAGSNTAYYDDIRVEPFAAEMETYVYDPSSLRTLATLDINNYATIYEYNDEGVLLRVKKETERGIKTIKETRSSYPRK
jgi:hypothetical protein